MVTVPKKPVFVMVSGDVKAASLTRLRHIERLELHHLYQRTRKGLRADDTTSDDHVGRHVRYRSAAHLFRLLWRIEPDIVQGPEPFSLLMLPYLLAVFAYVRLRPKTRLVVVTLENLAVADKYTRLAVPLFQLILRPYFRRASCAFWFVPGSEENLRVYGAPPERLVNQIYGTWGVDLAVWNPDGPQAHVRPGVPTIMYVGRLAREKGVAALIAAFNALRAQGLSAHLVIIGDGPEREALELQARQSPYGPDINFLGLIKNRDLPPYLRAATVVVNPFFRTRLWSEQWAYVLQQAMACGVPVITTDTPSMRELVAPGAGLFFPERDTEALTERIATLLGDSALRARMGRHAREYAVQRFDESHNTLLSEQTILERCGFAGTETGRGGQPLVAARMENGS